VRIIFRKMLRRIRRANLGNNKLRLTVDRAIATVRYGTAYGGWHLPDPVELTETSVCILVGAGEDISFDVAIARMFKSQVIIADPTPRAVHHFYQLLTAVTSRQPMLINNSTNDMYECDYQDLERIRFTPVGLSDVDAVQRFYLPVNPEHVSCSITNIQDTSDYFEAPCVRLVTLLKQQKVETLDLLKLDIEGAEHRVIRDMLSSAIFPRILLVEFDDRNPPQLAATLARLRLHKYSLVHAEGNNTLFIRTSNE